MDQNSSNTINDSSLSSVDQQEQILSDKKIEFKQSDETQTSALENFTMNNESSLAEIVNISYRKCFPKTILQPTHHYKFEPTIKEADVQYPLNFKSNKIFSCRFDPFGSFVANGCEDGVIRIVSNITNSVAYNLVDSAEKASPVTCVRWRPSNPQDNIKFTLLATYSNGSILLWHSTSNQILVRIKEEDNAINCCDYSCDGLRFVTGGQDTKVRLYDAGRAKPIAIHTEAGPQAPKHSNRIFALKHHQTEPFVLYSAGWDNTILIWDLRVKQPQQFIYGPHICGDALDQNGNHLLTGSWRDENQLEVWDLRQLSKVVGIKWDNFASAKVDPQLAEHYRQRSLIYSACFDKNGTKIYAGSAGTLFSEIRIFDPEDNYRCQDAYTALSRGVLSMDCFGKQKQRLAYGVADGTLGIMELNI